MSLPLERCCECNAPTGMAGLGDDSLYTGENGPFCKECFTIIESVATNRIAELEAELAKAQEDAPKWISVEKQVPAKGSSVFSFWGPAIGCPVPAWHFGVATYTGRSWHNPEDDDDDYAKPTHWMPLPAAPTPDSEAP